MATGGSAVSVRRVLAGGLFAASLSALAFSPLAVAGERPALRATGAVVAPPVVPPQVLAPATGSIQESAAPVSATWVAALDRSLASSALGSDVTGLVSDAVTGQVLYSKSPKRPQRPASTIKILTGIAVLKAYGPDARLTTTVVSGSGAGEIVLRGGGDSTLARVKSPAAGWPAGQSAQPATLTALAAQTAAALRTSGLTSVTLNFDDSLFVGSTLAAGWKPSFVAAGVVSPVMALSADGGRTSASSATRSEDPARAAATFFAGRLRSLGINVAPTIERIAGSHSSAGQSPTKPVTASPQPAVTGGAPSSGPAGDSTAGSTPTTPTVLASVQSPPMSALVERMLTRSDDDLAEALGHLAGGRLVASASFEGGVRATYDTLEQLGMSMRGLKLADASGLSSLNELDSTTFTEALEAAVQNKPFVGSSVGTLWPVTSGLPIAGVTGTLSDRFTSAKTVFGRGIVRAKTGTLTGVIGLAGIVRDTQGRLLIFDFDADQAPGPLAAAREAVDQAATVVAAG